MGVLVGLEVADVFGKEPGFGDESLGGADFGDFLAGEKVLTGWCDTVLRPGDGSVVWGA